VFTHWELDVNTYDWQLSVHLVKRHWEHQNQKMFKIPTSSQKEKNLILGCMLHHLIDRAKFLSPKMFVTLFQLDLMPHSLISLRWTIIFYTTLNLELVICLVSNQSTLKDLGKPGKIQWYLFTQQCMPHGSLIYRFSFWPLRPTWSYGSLAMFITKSGLWHRWSYFNNKQKASL
jgi:hypothetical protein